MNDITPKEANEILRHYTDLGYGIVIEGDDVSKIIQALSLARKTLANDIPIGDCISRSALLNQIDTTDWSDVRLLVEDAPTVPLPNEQIAWEQGYEAGLAQGKHDRPKGEWINREAISNTIFPFWERYECNQCHKFNGYSNFCPNCGAEMQKGDVK